MWDFLCDTPGGTPTLWLARVLASAFLAVLFLQSGADKVFDRRGNLDWLTAHFANSPLAGSVATLLSVVTAFELLAGALSAAGGVALLIGRGETLALAGIVTSAVTLLMLFFGQRMAKDYAGSAVITTYFLLTLVALSLYARPPVP